jgi:hypothetical protein
MLLLAHDLAYASLAEVGEGFLRTATVRSPRSSNHFMR